jgi:hypothetical protein
MAKKIRPYVARQDGLVVLKAIRSGVVQTLPTVRR